MNTTKINPATLRTYLRAEAEAARAQAALKRAEQRLIEEAAVVLGDNPNAIQATDITREGGHFIIDVMLSDSDDWCTTYCLIDADGEVIRGGRQQ